MPRRRRIQGVESSQDLERKLEILERELEVQRAAALTFQERGQKEGPKWFEQATTPGRMPSVTQARLTKKPMRVVTRFG